MTVCQEGEGGPAAGVGVVDEGEDGDGLVEALLLDERVDGAGVLPVLDVELIHAAVIQCPVCGVSSILCPVVTEECVTQWRPSPGYLGKAAPLGYSATSNNGHLYKYKGMKGELIYYHYSFYYIYFI